MQHVFAACPNPTNPSSQLVIRPVSLADCAPRIEDMRTIATRFRAELPSFAVSDSLRAGLDTGLSDLLQRIDHFKDVELHGSDADVFGATDLIGNAFDEIRQAGR